MSVISSSGRGATVILTKPKDLSNQSGTLESVVERIEGSWRLIQVMENHNAELITYLLNFYGEDDSFQFSLRCAKYQEVAA